MMPIEQVQNRPAAPHRLRFSLRFVFSVLTACAIVTWITVAVGFIPIIGSLGSILIGGLAGAVVGMGFGTSVRSALVGAIAALIAVDAAIIWLLWIIGSDILAQGRPFPVVIPLQFTLRDGLIFSAAALALVAAVPSASIAAVYRRESDFVLLWPAFTCATTAFLAGIAFLAYDVWCRGGFPQPPLPWPIAFAIPLFAGIVAAGFWGLISGLLWLGIRSLLHRSTATKASSE